MIDFLKYAWLYLLISIVVIGVGLFSIANWGYKYSIDFVGGTNLEYQFDKPIQENSLKKIINNNKFELVELSKNGTIYIIRLKAVDEKKEVAFKNDLQKKFKTNITVLRSETVGPVLGRETVKKTIVASLLAIVGILVYMSFSFKGINFAVAAILAMFHDFIVVVGTYSLFSHFFGAQVDTLFVTALLTTMSFSVHDTIIIFDKIREYVRNEGKGDFEYNANRALTETLVRSFNNSMTIIFMLLSLTLLGGSTIKFFVATLLVGTITGTYSSPFIATPILIFFERIRKK